LGAVKEDERERERKREEVLLTPEKVDGPPPVFGLHIFGAGREGLLDGGMDARWDGGRNAYPTIMHDWVRHDIVGGVTMISIIRCDGFLSVNL
jgi:hypothetical protein